MTYNACGTIKWNNGVSYPIQSGHGCIGCSEANFWDNGPFYERLTNMPGFGIEENADKIGMIATGAIAGGLAVHAVAANVKKRQELKHRREAGQEVEKKVESKI
jgi:hydrogenase small subunit